MTLGNRIRNRRKELGLTQVELAKKPDSRREVFRELRTMHSFLKQQHLWCWRSLSTLHPTHFLKTKGGQVNA